MGVALVGSKVQAVQLPPYLPLGTGNRPLYPGDTKINNHVAPKDQSPPLTQFEICTQVYIRLIPNVNAPVGWYINSAWPE